MEYKSELKFRAWIESHGYMIYTGRNKELEAIQFQGDSITIYEGDGDNQYENFALMQYTERKDVKQTEIYEGDLVHIGGEPYKYEVIKFECEFQLKRVDLNLIWGRLSRLNEIGWSCKVVGNIYEQC